MKKLFLILWVACAGFASCEKDTALISGQFIFPPAEEEPDTFYAYFRLVNRSGHPMLFEFNDGGCDVVDAYCMPGSAVVYSKWNELSFERRTEPSFGLDGFLGFCFDPQIGEPWSEWGPAVYFRDFTVDSAEPNPGDRSQWTYERFDALHVRWTYSVTDADYRYALAHPELPF